MTEVWILEVDGARIFAFSNSSKAIKYRDKIRVNDGEVHTYIIERLLVDAKDVK